MRTRIHSSLAIPLVMCGLQLFAAEPAAATAKRVVVIKLDGLPGWYVEKALQTKDPATGKSRAPWIDHIFDKNGVRFLNFYTRGISLSVPAWQILDTGMPSQIHGNAEFDRYTSHVYDYLNFFPFYVDYSRGKMADMPSVEVIDEAGLPMLLDRFAPGERLQSYQLNQRGLRLKALPRALKSRFMGIAPKQLMDEWQAGFFSIGRGVFEQMEKDLIARLQDPKTRYLDHFSGDFDHQTHLTMDAFSHTAVFEKIDRQIGRIWEAIQRSPLAEETLLAVVSDHGMNTTEGVFSQGYSLVNYFTSAEGGGHHVVTNRHVLQEYKLMGLDPWVYRVTTESEFSPYLQGKHKQYPTVLLDLDGNERASVYFRNNHLNRLHMALEHRQDALALSILDSQRARWKEALSNLRPEIARLRKRLADTPEPLQVKSDEDRRVSSHRHTWGHFAARYEEYAKSLDRLLALDAAALKARKYKIEELIPPGAMGELNSPEDLQNYAVELRSDGTFRTINYLAALTALKTRNVVQKELSPYPVDFVAMEESPGGPILLYAGPDRRVRLLRDPAASGTLRYAPVDGWKEGLPLRIVEDPEFRNGRAWLEQPHDETEWLRATHRTRYSNGVPGLAEQFNRPSTKQRALARADLLILANDHWNFNVRSFNPGGNHGSFFRISTHSTLMFWGGAKTGVGRGVRIEEPYDSLIFVPTVLKALGMPHGDLPGKAVPLR